MTVIDPVVPPPVTARAVAAPEASAVSWAAVFAGVFAALATAFVLGELAAGFGYATPSPWLATHAGIAGFTPLVGAGMVLVEVLALGLGGYLAGRLRTRWDGVHTDEVHFRDTAHGLIVWAVTVVVGVALAALVTGPYAEHLSAAEIIAASSSISPAAAAAQVDRLAHLQAQAAFFMALGLILSAFVAAVAAAVGGARREEMHGNI